MNINRRGFLKNVASIGAMVALPSSAILANTKAAGTGLVKGRVHSAGKPLANVPVTDGYTVVTTDKKGNYSIPLHSDAEFVFISIPAGYTIPNEKGLARFYKPLTKQQENQTADFELQKSALDDNHHALIVWADTQMVKDKDAETLITVSAPDTAAMIKSLGNIPVHGITVGDLVHDRFDLFDDYARAVEVTGVPFFQAIGNHDMDYAARTDDQSESKYKSLFGPAYYSFNRGKIHYVVLDDVFFIGKGHNYIGYITETQLRWLEQDLNLVPKGSTVIVSLHIPTNTGAAERNGVKKEEPGSVVSNREHLYKLLQPYKVHIMSGHTHWNENWETDNMMEHNHGTVCGAWWREQNMAADGTPNGYAVYEIKGDDINWFYKSTGKPVDHQMTLYTPGRSKAKPQAVIANVWNWDKKWKVECFEDGVSKGVMEQIRCSDPAVVEAYPEHMHVLSDHFFALTPSPGTKEITVKATDRFGKVYQEKIKLV